MSRKTSIHPLFKNGGLLEVISIKTAIAAIALLIFLILFPVAAAQEEAAIYTVNINYEIRNEGPNDALKVRATVYLFDNISEWAEQKILHESIMVDGNPTSFEASRGEENRWTIIELGNLKSGQSRTISVTQVVKVKSVAIPIDPSRVSTSFPPELERYTQAVPGLFESDNELIIDLANQIVGSETNPYLKLQRIMQYLVENFTYEKQNEEHGALWALLSGRGDCTEFSNLMIALARAVGIPAKAVPGYVYLPAYENMISPTLSELGHEYGIFYMPGYGWIPADAVWPLYCGSLGSSDQYRIAGMATGGESAVEDGRIRWQVPGYITRRWGYYTGKPTEVSGETNGEIVPNALLKVQLNVEEKIENDGIGVQVRVQNLGTLRVENLRTELIVDPEKFYVAEEPNEIPFLGPQAEQTVSGTIGIKENGYGCTTTFGAAVVFDPVYPGESGYLSSGEIEVGIPVKPVLLPGIQDLILPILIGAVVGAIVAVGIILIKR